MLVGIICSKKSAETCQVFDLFFENPGDQYIPIEKDLESKVAGEQVHHFSCPEIFGMPCGPWSKP